MAAPDRPPRLAPLARFWTLFSWGLRRTVSRKKGYLVAAVALLLGISAGSFIPGPRDRTVYFAWHMMDHGLLVFGVPIIALALVGGGFGEEVQDQTLVFHLVRPVSRRTIFLARFAAGLVPGAVTGAAFLVSFCLASGARLPGSTVATIGALGALGVAATGAVYYALAALFRRGLIAGLVYTFVIEVLCGLLPGSIQKVSLMHHVRSLYHRLTDDTFSSLSFRVRQELQPGEGIMTKIQDLLRQWSSVDGALLTLVCVMVLALWMGARSVARQDYALKD
jgi:ABC-type transport system involved in multi-copper enzyme maturation permease subunit